MKTGKKLHHLPRHIVFLTAFVGVILISMSIWLLSTKSAPGPVPPTARYLDPTQPIEVRVADLLSYMTTAEKIGQMALVERNSLIQLRDIRDYSLGALLSGSGSKPESNTARDWATMTATYQAEAAASRLGIPLLYGSDAIHGHAHVGGATVFPHMIGLGAARNPDLVREVAQATAEAMAATGVNWNFAPNLDLPHDVRWGRVYEAFSDDPTLVAELGAAYVAGLQSYHADATSTGRTLATLKHFVGLGGMGWGTSLNQNFKIDQGVTPADEKLLRAVYLPPFAAAIDEGALSIMVGLNTWGDERTIRQRALLTGLLKEELGFKGFLVSDWYGVHEGVSNNFLATVAAINAGVDMVMLPFDYQTFVRHMTWANRLGLISDARIDDAVSRILYAKFSLGLFDQPATGSVLPAVTNESHRALARSTVAESLVLLKNDNATLPLTPAGKKIRVAGSAADNVGRQMGAWSIEWQGIDGNWPPYSTSILAGLREVAGQNSVIEYEAQGVFSPDSPKAAVGIAVVGEAPYAEGWGDNPFPSLSEEDRRVIKNLQDSCEKVVVVLVTGRPLFITDEMKDWDALVVAWLPGSEGAGVADVLFGQRSFTGSLPLPWLAQVSQLPLTPEGLASDGTDVLFPRYFGLRY